MFDGAEMLAPLVQDVEDEELTQEELKERKIMKLLLKVKNGTPPQRKSALRQLTDKARDLGAEALFNQILPLLMSPTLEDQERHLLVKVRPLLSALSVMQQQMNRVSVATTSFTSNDKLHLQTVCAMSADRLIQA